MKKFQLMLPFLWAALAPMPSACEPVLNFNSPSASDPQVNFNSPLEIVGGTDTSFAAHPYYVELQGYSGGLVCGGSLVWEDVVLSAAHCAGMINGAKVGPDQVSVPVLEEEKHPDYDSYNTNWDFMAIKLGSSALDEGASTISLNRNGAVPMDNDDLVVIGLGTLYSSGPLSDELQEVTVQYVPNSECNDAYGSITEAMLCAGVDGGGMDSCQGDSGGPIFQGDAQVGVVSWGMGCAMPGYPGVYSRVSSAYEWIHAKICCLSDNPPADCDFSQCPTQAPTPAPLDCESGTTLFQLILQTDDYPEEIAWDLTNDCASTTVGSGGAYGSFTQYIEQYCLDSEQHYTFTIYDSYGDGLIAPGGYSVLYDGVLQQSNDPYGYDRESVSFGGTCPPLECGSGTTLFVLDLQTDSWPAEVSWELTNDCTSTVAFSASEGTYLSHDTAYTKQLCLDDGMQYTFTIKDGYGDGLCHPGGYSIHHDGELVMSGGDYSYEESTTFGLPAGSPLADSATVIEIALDEDFSGLTNADLEAAFKNAMAAVPVEGCPPVIGYVAIKSRSTQSVEMTVFSTKASGSSLIADHFTFLEAFSTGLGLVPTAATSVVSADSSMPCCVGMKYGDFLTKERCPDGEWCYCPDFNCCMVCMGTFDS